jgi:hypothetical protein
LISEEEETEEENGKWKEIQRSGWIPLSMHSLESVK